MFGVQRTKCTDIAMMQGFSSFLICYALVLLVLSNGVIIEDERHVFRMKHLYCSDCYVSAVRKVFSSVVSCK